MVKIVQTTVDLVTSDSLLEVCKGVAVIGGAVTAIAGGIVGLYKGVKWAYSTATDENVQKKKRTNEMAKIVEEITEDFKNIDKVWSDEKWQDKQCWAQTVEHLHSLDKKITALKKWDDTYSDYSDYTSEIAQIYTRWTGIGDVRKSGLRTDWLSFCDKKRKPYKSGNLSEDSRNWNAFEVMEMELLDTPYKEIKKDVNCLIEALETSGYTVKRQDK